MTRVLNVAETINRLGQLASQIEQQRLLDWSEAEGDYCSGEEIQTKAIYDGHRDLRVEIEVCYVKHHPTEDHMIVKAEQIKAVYIEDLSGILSPVFDETGILEDYLIDSLTPDLKYYYQHFWG